MLVNLVTDIKSLTEGSVIRCGIAKTGGGHESMLI